MLQYTRRDTANDTPRQAAAQDVLSRSQWIERNLTASGHPLNLNWRPWWRMPLDIDDLLMDDKDPDYKGEKTNRREIVMLCGRQVEKSTSLGNLAIAGMRVKHTSTLYVAPSSDQLSEFSFRRLDTIVESSPKMDALRDQVHWSVGRKAFKNKSTITLRGAYKNPDRCRGIPADWLFIDEAQDIILEHIPVIRECMTHCTRPGGPGYRLVGTPKSYSAPLEHYWSRESTQNEWMVRCSHCGFWNEGLFTENIGKHGLICTRCSKMIDPFGKISGTRRTGAGWIRTGPEGAYMEGFRIPQMLLPYSFAYDRKIFRKKWAELLYKQRTYTKPKFYNEVLGVSYDTGDKPITTKELKETCTWYTGKMLDLDTPEPVIPSPLVVGNVFCGIDWGTGDGSYTVLTAARYVQNVYEVFYIKRFMGLEADPDYVIRELIRQIRLLRANYIGMDYGMGFGMNPQVQSAFGYDTSLVFAHTMQRDYLRWDSSAGMFTTNRSAVLSSIFTMIKRGPQEKTKAGMGGLRFRCGWDEFRHRRDFARDFLDVHKETTRMNTMIYQHPPGTTDDVLHSTAYGFLASTMKFKRHDLM